jgi:hypothetical protein
MHAALLLILFFGSTTQDKPSETKTPTAKPPTVEQLTAAKAIDTVQKEFVENFKGQQRPYNVAILPAEKSELHANRPCPRSSSPNSPSSPSKSTARSSTSDQPGKCSRRRNNQSTSLRSRSAFTITDTELSVIARLAIMGLKRSPTNG